MLRLDEEVSITYRVIVCLMWVGLAMSMGLMIWGASLY